MDTQEQLGRGLRSGRGKRVLEYEAHGAADTLERLNKRRRTKKGRGEFARLKNTIPTPEPSCLTESQSSVEATTAQPHTETLLVRKDVFPFLDLPAELRVHIYRMALQRDEPILLHLPRAEEASEEENLDDHTTTAHHISPTHSPSLPITDPITPALLRTCSLIHKEARPVLYADNIFTLLLPSGIHTLSTLHQRSRSLIKAVTLTIPSHHDILDGFADLVRLGLRYCWGLKTFTIVLDVAFPDDRVVNGATSVYANAFHILRWLPKGCRVILEGSVSEVVRRVVVEEGRLLEELDVASYLKRQHQMPERHCAIN